MPLQMCVFSGSTILFLVFDHHHLPFLQQLSQHSKLFSNSLPHLTEPFKDEESHRAQLTQTQIHLCLPFFTSYPPIWTQPSPISSGTLLHNISSCFYIFFININLRYYHGHCWQLIKLFPIFSASFQWFNLNLKTFPPIKKQSSSVMLSYCSFFFSLLILKNSLHSLSLSPYLLFMLQSAIPRLLPSFLLPFPSNNQHWSLHTKCRRHFQLSSKSRSGFWHYITCSSFLIFVFS